MKPFVIFPGAGPAAVVLVLWLWIGGCDASLTKHAAPVGMAAVDDSSSSSVASFPFRSLKKRAFLSKMVDRIRTKTDVATSAFAARSAAASASSRFKQQPKETAETKDEQGLRRRRDLAAINDRIKKLSGGSDASLMTEERVGVTTPLGISKTRADKLFPESKARAAIAPKSSFKLHSSSSKEKPKQTAGDPLQAENIAACRQELAIKEAESAGALFCSCEELFDVTVLECSETCGVYCNDEGDVCGRPMSVVAFSQDDASVQYTGDHFLYTTGDLMGQRIELDIDSFGNCVYLGGNCDCMMQACGNGTQAPLLDCSSQFGPDDVFDLCQNDLVVDTGFFEYLSSTEFNVCVDNSPENDLCSDLDAPVPIDGFLMTGSLFDALPYRAETCASGSDDVGIWYNVVGQGAGVRVSTCNAVSDFDTQISVYAGTCDALQCAAGNDDDIFCGASSGFSTVIFFGEQDVLYHVRVHGFGGRVGNFGLTMEEVNAALASCEEAVFESNLFTDPLTGTVCECEESGPDAILTCRDECSFCSLDKDVCSTRTSTSEIEIASGVEAVFVATSVTHEYTQGLEGIVVFETSGCGIDEVCSACRVLVDDVACNSCELSVCTNFEQGFDIDCVNVDPNAAFSSCDTNPAETGPLQVLSDDGFELCLRDPLEACESLSLLQQSSGCTCTGTNSSATYECPDTDCTYCNLDFTVCTIEANGANFDDEGQIVSSFWSYEYVSGRGELLVLTRAGDSDTCTLSVDGELCNSCEYVTSNFCFDGLKVDCENVEMGASFDACEGAFFQGGVLQALTKLSQFPVEFSQCLDPTADAEAICLQEKANREVSFGDFEISCDCEGPGSSEGYTLTCGDTCNFCDNERDVCGRRTSGEEIDRFGQFFEFILGFEYESGRDEVVLLRTVFDSSCGVTVGDEQCSSCETAFCTDEDDNFFLGYTVECDNVPMGTNITSCTDDYEGFFAHLTPGEFEECIIPQDPAAACSLEANQTQDDDENLVCECTDTENMGSTLECLSPFCQYCNANQTVCGVDTKSDTTFDRFGSLSFITETFQYIKGRDEELTLAVSFPAFECTVSINGETCASCETSFFCDDGSSDLKIDCSNLDMDGESIVYECGEGHPIFQLIDDDLFEECLPYTPPTTMPTTEPSGAPTSSPTLMPTSTPTTSSGMSASASIYVGAFASAVVLLFHIALV
jgi:hypothetical protein